MTLNIKDRETRQLAQELAKETGETMTRAVTNALREQLKRVRAQRRATMLARDLVTIGRRCAQTLKRKPVDHAERLYDDRGVPR